MLVKVCIKDNFSEKYSVKEYVFETDLDIGVNDIVAVTTQNGYCIAKVIEINCAIEGLEGTKIKQVAAIVRSEKERLARIKAEHEKCEKYNGLVYKIRKEKIKNKFKTFLSEEDAKLIDGMSREELDIFYKSI